MLYISDNVHRMARHVAKFHKVLISQFLTPLEKIIRGTSTSGGVCASKTWPFCGACKNFKTQHQLAAEIWYSEKVNYVGTI